MLWHVLISLAEDSHFSCAFTFLAGTIGKKGIQTEKALAISRKGLIVWLPETDLNRQPSD